MIERIKIHNPTDFGKVAVMYGGSSSERKISIRTGKAVLDALLALKVDAHGWDTAKRNFVELSDAKFDRVWVALHGSGGEDGSIQGVLEWLGIPYTGSGILASASAIDKIVTKDILIGKGIPTPAYRVVTSRGDILKAIEEFKFPLILKPSDQGSSVGMSLLSHETDINKAIELALSFNGIAFIEEYIVGEEITVAILQGEALPSIRIETPHKFYDYRAKYESKETKYVCPGINDVRLENQYRELALSTFDSIRCEGWGRVDFIKANSGKPQVLEVNTIPGMTKNSLFPIAASKLGIHFDELCWRILETSMIKHQE